MSTPERPLSVVVIADDEPDVLRLLLSRLRRRGYDVIAATDGHQALYAVRAHCPAAVVLDYVMPGLQGTKVCAMLKADPDTAHIPVLMLTSRSDETAVAAAFEHGADEYLTKPFDFDELDVVLRAHIDRSC